MPCKLTPIQVMIPKSVKTQSLSVTITGKQMKLYHLWECSLTSCQCILMLIYKIQTLTVKVLQTLSWKTSLYWQA